MASVTAVVVASVTAVVVAVVVVVSVSVVVVVAMVAVLVVVAVSRGGGGQCHGSNVGDGGASGVGAAVAASCVDVLGLMLRSLIQHHPLTHPKASPASGASAASHGALVLTKRMAPTVSLCCHCCL